ncbi:hypothetical protein [Aliarcobacter cryaerophilus]|uniref:hypothetical protein n=1 Tax=Aliarcobacter cryaerophilus TaxID=28198 RepID=UPI003DA2DBAB
MNDKILYLLIALGTFCFTVYISYYITPHVYNYFIEYDKRNIIEHLIDKDSGKDDLGYWIVV